MNTTIKEYDDITEESIINSCFRYGERPFADYNEQAVLPEDYDSAKRLNDFQQKTKSLEHLILNTTDVPFAMIQSNDQELKSIEQRLTDIEQEMPSSNISIIKKRHELEAKLFEIKKGFRLHNKELMTLISEIMIMSDEYIHKHYSLNVFATTFYEAIKSKELTSTAQLPLNNIMENEAMAINSFVNGLREKTKSKDYQKKLSDFKSSNKRNFNSGAKLVNRLFDNYSKIMVVRVDLGYTSKNMGGRDDDSDLSRREINLNKVSDDRRKFFNNIRQTSIGSALIGHIWKLEYGEDKGFHYHMIFFFDGAKVHKDSYYADEIGKYWSQITGGIGCYFNCNRAKSEYKRLGIGMISHYDHELRDNLIWVVLAYLVKKDQMISCDTGKHRTFGRSEIPKPKNPSGRPRKDRLGEQLSKSTLDNNAKKIELYRQIVTSDLTPSSPEYNRICRESKPILEVPLGKLHDNEIFPLESSSTTWTPSKESNGFFMVLGSSGSGKTETLKKIGSELVYQGVPVLLFDFHGDVILPYTKSILMSSGTESTVGINPLDIPYDFSGRTGPEDQRGELVSMFRRAIPKLSHQQSHVLRQALDAAYRCVGIVDDDDYTWRNDPPVMSLIVEILQDWSSSKEIDLHKGTLRSCVSIVNGVFGHAIFHRERNLSIREILSSNTRIDLSSVVDDSIRFLVTETILRMVFNELRKQGPIPVHPADDSERFRLFVIIDEAKILTMGSGDINGKDRILNVLATEGRKFGIGLILASQMSSHFSDEVNANMGSRLVLRPMSYKEAKANADDIKVSPEKISKLTGKGDGFYRCGSNGRTIRIQVQQVGEG